MGDLVYLQEEDSLRADLAEHLEHIAQLVRERKVDHVTAVYLHSDHHVTFTRDGYLAHGDDIIRIVGTCQHHVAKLLKVFEQYTGFTKQVEKDDDSSGEASASQPDDHEPEEA